MYHVGTPVCRSCWLGCMYMSVLWAEVHAGVIIIIIIIMINGLSCMHVSVRGLSSMFPMLVKLHLWALLQESAGNLEVHGHAPERELWKAPPPSTAAN
jgi:hypothetical protein